MHILKLTEDTFVFQYDDDKSIQQLKVSKNKTDTVIPHLPH